MTGGPTSPFATASLIPMKAGFQRFWKSTMAILPDSAAAAASRLASSTLVASGFSTKTFLPAFSISIVTAVCRWSGVAMLTPSTSDAATSAASSVHGTPRFSPTSRALSRSASQTRASSQRS